MRAVDTVLLAALEATGVTIHDGYVATTTGGSNVVSYTLPFAVYYSSIGDDPATEENMRLTGQRGRRSVFFSIAYVGRTRDQAKWAGERIHLALQGKRFTYAGVNKSWPVWIEESQRIRRDDDAIRPDGSPLFYGVSEGAVSITLTPQGAP